MEYLPWLSLALGLGARAFLPWLAKRRLNPEAYGWQWKLFWPQLLGFLLIALVLPLVIGNLEAIQNLGAQAAWLVGWGAADIGSQTYKAIAKDNDL